MFCFHFIMTTVAMFMCRPMLLKKNEKNFYSDKQIQVKGFLIVGSTFLKCFHCTKHCVLFIRFNLWFPISLNVNSKITLNAFQGIHCWTDLSLFNRLMLFHGVQWCTELRNAAGEVSSPQEGQRLSQLSPSLDILLFSRREPVPLLQAVAPCRSKVEVSSFQLGSDG